MSTITPISFKLPVVITKQGKRYVAYTPALDLSTSGKTERQVKENFAELANIFLEEIKNEGTINEVLSELGWKKVQRTWSPPAVIYSDSIGVRMPALV